MASLILWQITGYASVLMGAFFIFRGFFLLQKKGADNRFFVKNLLIGLLFIFVIPYMLRLYLFFESTSG